MEADDRAALLVVTRDATARPLGAEWVAVLDLATGDVLVAGERAPSSGWLAAFVNGMGAATTVGGTDAGPSDVIWTPLPGTACS